jgi:hypothetical protein
MQPDPYLAPLSTPQTIADGIAANQAQMALPVLGERVVSDSLHAARLWGGDFGAQQEAARLEASAGADTMRQAGMNASLASRPVFTSDWEMVQRPDGPRWERDLFPSPEWTMVRGPEGTRWERQLPG